MTKQKRGIILSNFVAIFFCVALSFSLGVSHIKADDENENYEDDTEIGICQDTVWHSSDNLNFTKKVSIYYGATLIIEKGARVRFNKDINGDDTGIVVYNGQLVANGEQDAPIDIASDSDHNDPFIKFYGRFYSDDPEPGVSFLRYVKIHGAGHKIDGGGAQSSFLRNFVSTAYAGMVGSSAVSFFGGKAHFENCDFYDNKNVDVAVQYNEDDILVGEWSYLEIINSNFEKDGDSYALQSEMVCKNPEEDCAGKVLLKNDWYDNVLGPTEDSSMIKKGKRISGSYKLDFFKDSDLVVDPVIVVPGILGSAPQTSLGGKLVLDPILHIYDNLMLSFEKNGYTKNKNIFTFPYEWRNSNIETAVSSTDSLKEKIYDVKNETKISKVDLVAHSMGGLVARYYIESPAYQDDVDQLVTLGTPQHGAPEDYLSWEAGEIGSKFEDNIEEGIFWLEAKHAGFSNLKDYIQLRVRSVQELLPDYNYLKEASSGDMRTYPNNYPINTFLDFLNSSSALIHLEKVNFTNIVGNVSGEEKTIKDFKVVNSTEDGKWENGMPENYGGSNSGFKYGQGDGTVPIDSSENVVSDNQVEVDSSHADLPTNAQCDVIEKLTGKNNCDYINDIKRITHILTFGVFSPIDIQIIAPDGVHWAGKNIRGLGVDDQIEGSFYTGSDTENEFVTIPNPENNKYTIITEGTGDGEYTVEVSKISEDENNPGRATEIVTDITGTATTGQIEEKTANVSAESITIENTETTPPEKEMTPALFRAEVEKYYKENSIKNKSAKNILLSSMKLIEDENNFLKMIKANPFLDKRTKKILITILERGIANQFKSLAKLIDKDKKSYDPTIKNVLIKDLKLVESGL